MENKTILEQAIKMRNDWATGDAIRDEGLIEPENIVKLKDIPYTSSDKKEDERWHLTDIYLPEDRTEDSDKSYPVIVSVHGGGWFYGDKELYRHYTMYLATKGFVVVNFNYRLSPENVYPAGFSDVCALMEFVKINASKYHFDMSRLFMVGDSCGAQLTSQYSVYVTSKEYRDLVGFSYDCPVPAKVALNCGIYDMKDLQNHENDRFLADWYIEGVTDEKILKSFYDILDYMNESFPSTYLMMSVNDGLNIYTPAMKEKLETLNIPFEYHEFGQDNVNDSHVFHLNMKSENGRICNEEEVEFFLK